MAEKSMTKFVITGRRTAQTVEAEWYQQEGDFFVFYADGQTRRSVVATVAADGVHSITIKASKES